MKNKPYQKVYGVDGQLTKIQANVERAISNLRNTEILDGRLIKDLSLSSGSNKIEHKLGRAALGYNIVRQSNAITYYDTAIDDKYIHLTVSANVTLSLWVF